MQFLLKSIFKNISKYSLSILLFSLILVSCIKEPNAPIQTNENSKYSGLYVLCEGLWHYNNSTLAKINEENGNIISDYFQYINNYKLGDLANSAVLYKDHIYIVLTTSANILKIDIKTGKSIAKLQLKMESDPRHIYILNDTIAYITHLMNHNVSVINPLLMIDKNIEIPVGPAPEYICGDGQYAYIANSAYGDYLADQVGAATISVINTKTNSEINKIPCGDNTIELIYNKKYNKLYACYYHLPSLKDSIGGIVEYNLPNPRETNRLRTRANALAFSEDYNYLYYNTEEGVWKVNLMNNSFKPELIIKNPNKNEKWYSIAQFDNKIYIANARNFTSKGEIIVYSINDFSDPINKYNVGLNPNSIIKIK